MRPESLIVQPRKSSSRASFSLPPLDFCSGGGSSDAAKWRPDRKRSGSVTDSSSAVAVMMPAPGIVASRCDSSLDRCHVDSSFSGVASCSCTAPICCTRLATTCSASVGTSAAWPSVSRLANASAWCSPRGIATPNSASTARIMMMSCVRCLTNSRLAVCHRLTIKCESPCQLQPRDIRNAKLCIPLILKPAMVGRHAPAVPPRFVSGERGWSGAATCCTGGSGKQ